MKYRQFIIILGALMFPAALFGQARLNAEAAQLQKNAATYLQQQDYDNAIMLYKQAIREAPDNVALRRDLAYTYYLSGGIKKAKEVIDPVVNSDFADEQTYQVAAAIENVIGSFGRARRMLNEGIRKFPHSGLLYHSKGNLYLKTKNSRAALKVWQEGIAADPAYALNYYSAANALYEDQNYIWALLYGETYLNLEDHPGRGIEIKKQIIDAYRQLISADHKTTLPKFRSESDQDVQLSQNFRMAFMQVLLNNASAIRGGLTTETLTMLRTRFIMEWEARFSTLYPYTLFAYQNQLLRAGYFDSYNQWLFGAASNSQAFGIWIKNNAENYSKFEKWRTHHPLQPASFDPKP